MSKPCQIIGIAELNKVLKELPNAMKDKEARAEMRRQYRPVQKAMQVKAGHKTGNLAKSIRIKNGKYKKDVVDIWIGAQNKNRKASHWHIVHEGTDHRKIDSYKTRASTKAKMKTNALGERGIYVKINNSTIVFVSSTGKSPAKKYSEVDVNSVLRPANERMLRNREKAMLRKVERLKKKHKL
jgi:hypothetical protein